MNERAELQLIAMKKKTSFILLLVIVPVILFTHIGWQTQDDGLMFDVDGQKIDLVGIFKDKWRITTNSCEHVVQLDSDDPELAKIKALIQSYSPPDSLDIRVIHVWKFDKWAISEVEFERLLPAVVTLKNVDTGPAIIKDGIWSGTTTPWKSGPQIRSYLMNRNNGTPLELLNCFELKTKSFQ